MEFGTLSPMHCTCHDSTIKLEDLISPTQIKLLETLFLHYEDDTLLLEQRQELEQLDLYLHIPLVKAYFERSYTSLVALVENDCTKIPSDLDWNDMVIKSIEHGNLNVLKYIIENNKQVDTTMICEHAAMYGQFEILRYAHMKNFAWNSSTCHFAVHLNHIDILRYALEHGCPYDATICNSAALKQFNSNHDCNDNIHNLNVTNLEILKCLHQHGCPIDTFTCALAADSGKVDMVIYLHENGCAWDEWTCHNAAKNGHLSVLMYAYENGCPGNEWTCMTAAEYGQVHILKYLHEHHCPWDEQTCHRAAIEGHLECLQYAHQHGCPFPITKVYNTVISRNHQHIVQYIKSCY